MFRRVHQGSIMFQVLIFGSIALLFLGGLFSWASSNIKFGNNLHNRELLINIAEAGIEYYRWHLAHDADDFEDGTGQPGPYIHDFTNANGQVIGRFELEITPPLPGSSSVTIKSTGYLNSEPNQSRSIEAIMSKPSLAKFAVAANADMRFGVGTEIFGLVHSNGGIRYDGVAHNLVTSAKSDYNDPDHSGENEFAVHTHVSPIDPLPPSAVPDRPDVFEVGREFPVPAIDFSGFTSDLSAIKTEAQDSGVYLPNSGALGYRLELKTDDTFDIYRVDSLVAPGATCTNFLGESGWGSWSIANETYLSTYAIPANSAVFIEDDLWVNGQIDGARVSIAAGRFPENPTTNANITVNNDLLYTNIDGQDIIGLFAQNNINIGLIAEDDLRIDGALMAKNGRVGRFYYQPAGTWTNCAPYDTLTHITLFGMIGTNQRYGFAWSDGTGYADRLINYDQNLLLNPPPYFPVTSESYDTVSWRELD